MNLKYVLAKTWRWCGVVTFIAAAALLIHIWMTILFGG
jgi:hypothetical protein